MLRFLWSKNVKNERQFVSKGLSLPYGTMGDQNKHGQLSSFDRSSLRQKGCKAILYRSQ